MKPIIALTADEVAGASDVINMNFADMAPSEIKNAVVQAGGIPIILPYPDDFTYAKEMAAAAVTTFDGLILPGGPDVDPTYFGEEPIPQIGRTAYQKDAFEIELIKATVAAGKPIFGICRGLQVLNIALGGSVYQDLAAQYPEYGVRHPQAAPGGFPTHHVNITDDSKTAQLVGTTSYVNSRHHQGARNIGTGLRVTATAQDGVVEAIESEDSDQLLAVQWHPENMWRQFPDQFNFFKDIVGRASQFKSQH